MISYLVCFQKPQAPKPKPQGISNLQENIRSTPGLGTGIWHFFGLWDFFLWHDQILRFAGMPLVKTVTSADRRQNLAGARRNCIRPAA
jgi:hypothetical protein